MLLVAGWVCAATPLTAQFSLDARRIGMGGLSLNRSGDLPRYNPAYRAVPDRPGENRAKITIPIPLGLIQFFKDHPPSGWDTDPLFNPSDSAFNPVELANLLLSPPLFLAVKAIPTPTNDVEFTIGKNELIIDLGEAQVLIPSDEFGFGGTSRILDMGFGFKGFRAGIGGFLHHDVGFALDDSLRAVLKDASPVRPNTPYGILADATTQTGLAPFVEFAGKLLGDSAGALYIGVAVRRYMGAAFGHADGNLGFTTGDTIFAAPGPVEAVSALVTYSKFGNAMASGYGGDIGFVYTSGPIEFGFGVNDIGATLTWREARVDSVYWDAVGDSVVSTMLFNNVERETELPTSYIANVAFAMRTGTIIGGNILYNGRTTAIQVGGEQRVGMFGIRGGVGRDHRKRLQVGFGAGLFLGGLSFDVGLWTHSNALSDQRGITMATSLSIY